MVQKTQRENKRKRQLDAFIVHPFIERSKKYIFPAFNLSTEKLKVISLGNSKILKDLLPSTDQSQYLLAGHFFANYTGEENENIY